MHHLTRANDFTFLQEPPCITLRNVLDMSVSGACSIFNSIRGFSWVRTWVGLGAFIRWWPPSIMWAGLLIYLWPPPGMSEQSNLFEFGIMCCMLSTFHVSSRIVANISESSLLLSQHLSRLSWRNTIRKLLSLSLDMFFKILQFQVAFLTFFSIAIFSPYFLLVGFLWLYFSPGN